MSKHVSRRERWTECQQEEFYCAEGVVRKDRDNGCRTWVALIRDGDGLRVVGRGFKRARNAMMAVEEEVVKKERTRNAEPLPPIRFHAHLYGNV